PEPPPGHRHDRRDGRHPEGESGGVPEGAHRRPRALPEGALRSSPAHPRQRCRGPRRRRQRWARAAALRSEAAPVKGRKSHAATPSRSDRAIMGALILSVTALFALGALARGAQAHATLASGVACAAARAVLAANSIAKAI